MIKQLLLVFLGGGLGSAIRLVFSVWVNSHQFKWLPTMTVNLLGSLLLGVFFAASHKNLIDSPQYVLLGVGFCGGLTTFSTFSLDAFQLLKAHNYLEGIAYILISILAGFMMFFIGHNTIKTYF